MNSIIIISRKNRPANEGYYSHILTIWSIKLKPKMFMTILVRVKKCLIVVIILLR